MCWFAYAVSSVSHTVAKSGLGLPFLKQAWNHELAPAYLININDQNQAYIGSSLDTKPSSESLSPTV